MSNPRRALAISFSAQYLTLAVQFVATIIIARLLTPAEIGVFSIGAAVVALAHLLRDFGTGNYIVQEKELTEDRIRAALTVTLALGWGLAALLFAGSNLAGAFYENPGISDILALLAINFLLLPFGTVTMAYLQRQMNFKPGMISRFMSATVGATVSVACAYKGLSYMSLAWGSIAGSITSLLVALYYRPPGLPKLPGFREIPRIASFGGHMSAVTILSEISQVAPDLILGRTQGMAAVGLFSRAQGVIRIFHQAVLAGLSPVLGPYLAAIHRNNTELTRPYFYGLSCMTAVAWPFYIGLMIVAEDLILTLYGTQWVEATPVVQVWCIAMVVNFFSFMSDSLLVATGNVKQVSRIQLIVAPTQVVLVLLAAHYSLWVVASMFILTNFLRFVITWPILKKLLGIVFSQYLLAIKKSAIVSIATSASILSVAEACSLYGIQTPWIVVCLAGCAAAVAWLITLRVTSHPLWTELLSLRNKALQKLAS